MRNGGSSGEPQRWDTVIHDPIPCLYCTGNRRAGCYLDSTGYGGVSCHMQDLPYEHETVMEFLAHSANSDGNTHLLRDHLQAVGNLARGFAEKKLSRLE